METGIFAAGCFWKPDLEFEKLEGVKKTEVGYCGGNNSNTTYENVCTGTTNHAEVVKVYYDENIISYQGLKYESDKIEEPEFSNVSAPFYIINPARNDEDASKECLTLDKNGDISIEPCNLSNYQRWYTSGRERTC